MMMVSILSSSLTTVVIYRLSKLLHFTERIATIASLTYAYGTIVWVYAKSAFSHSITSFFVIGALYLVIMALNENNKKKLIFSGLAIGYAIVIRPTNILFVFPMSIYIILKTKQLRNVAIYLLSVFCDAIFLLLYNFITFGHPFVTGYHFIFDIPNRFSIPPYIGIWGLLFGISRGLIPYSPVLIFSIIGMYPWKTQKEEYILFLSSFLSILAFYSSFSGWFGGPYWGARYLIVVLSCFALFICPVIQKYESKWWFWITYYILLVYSSFSSLVGVSWRIVVPFLGYYPVFYHVHALITPDTILSYIVYKIGLPSWLSTILLAILVCLSYIFVTYPTTISYCSVRLKKMVIRIVDHIQKTNFR
jgi:hypothetical protein